jgi:hypothetical protein
VRSWHHQVISLDLRTAHQYYGAEGQGRLRPDPPLLAQPGVQELRRVGIVQCLGLGRHIAGFSCMAVDLLSQ